MLIFYTFVLQAFLLLLAVSQIFIYPNAFSARLGFEWSVITSVSIAALIATILIVIFRKGTISSSQETQLRYVVRVGIFSWLLLQLLYQLLVSIDSFYYLNYVLENFKLHYDAFPDVQFVLFATVVSALIIMSKQVLTKSTTSLGIITLIIYIGYLHLTATFQIISKRTANAVAMIHLSETDRKTASLSGPTMGGWIVPLTNFVNSHSDPESIILIPPQAEVWRITGNGAYMKSFIHPRTPISSLTKDLLIPEHATHILISHGLWYEQNGDWGWPKETIKAEDIDEYWEIHRPSGEITNLTGHDYVYELGIEKWGLIKIKKL